MLYTYGRQPVSESKLQGRVSNNAFSAFRSPSVCPRTFEHVDSMELPSPFMASDYLKLLYFLVLRLTSAAGSSFIRKVAF